jgi:S-adenosylmethionine decarboxylase
MDVGTEWLVDAEGCLPELLRDIETVRSVCEEVIADLGLRVVGDSIWHQFPQPAGVTGLYLLTESHLACHTFPETGLATFNLYCCRPRPPFAWEERLRVLLSATRVSVRTVPRGMKAADDHTPFKSCDHDSLETPDHTSFDAKVSESSSAHEVTSL